MTVNSIWNQVPPTGISYGGQTATDGVAFTLSQPAALTGIWYYSGPSENALPSACAIWDIASQTVVSGTQNNSPSWSGALGSGWVKCTYDGSITLDTRADGYVSSVQYSGNKGYNVASFPVTSGIITAPAVTITYLTNSPYGNNAGTLTFPSTGGGTLNWFLDVEVTTIPYTASYTLHNQSTSGYSPEPDTIPYTLGVQFSVSQACALAGIWFYSPGDVGGVPTDCVVWNANTQAQIPGTHVSSVVWTVNPAKQGDWVKCAYDGSVTLQPSVNYVASVFYADIGSVQWFGGFGNFWGSGGPGQNGITNGPLTAPNNAGAVNGQAPYSASSTLAFPSTNFSNDDWGVDVEVIPVQSSTGPAYTAYMSSM